MYLNGIYGWHLSHRPFHQWQAGEIYTVTLSCELVVIAPSVTGRAFEPCSFCQEHKLGWSGHCTMWHYAQLVANSWVHPGIHPQQISLYLKAPLTLSGNIVGRVLMSHWSQELHESKKHWIRSPPHGFSSLLCAPCLSLVPGDWPRWSHQGSHLPCTSSCAIGCLLHSCTDHSIQVLILHFSRQPLYSLRLQPAVWNTLSHLFIYFICRLRSRCFSEPHPEKPSCPFLQED